MAGINNRVSTGIIGFDKIIDMLRLGDNVVWQVDSVEEYSYFAGAYVKKAKECGRNIAYIRFGAHKPVIDDLSGVKVYQLKAEEGFEAFATKVHNIITDEGKEAFYVFDCLTDLLSSWYSDLMIGNFFKVTCPYLFELDTIAYFAVMRNAHTYDTIARIRETTQLLIDLYEIDGDHYVHPLKVWERYAPTMFFPHKIKDEEAISITASADAAALFSSFNWSKEKLDYWEVTFEQAESELALPLEEQEESKVLLLKLLLGKESRMIDLCRRYFTLEDLINIKKRQIGTGFIGGKSVGMLLARKILQQEGEDHFLNLLEPHDSFYLGSDIFYTYIVQNGWWKLRTKQKTPSGYFRHSEELKKRMLEGKFPQVMREQFQKMLEYFGQSPIIVRSSSLLEDNFGNAFAGKYESVFCVNQGTPDERYEAFEQAVRQVYASTMNRDALAYRANRGLSQQDEQMALLVQRVSGDYHGDWFFPHIAGVGNSFNLYVWDKSIDMTAGMLRLVLGLGTRAVERVDGDYPRIVCLDNPARPPLIANGDERHYSQHNVDVLDLKKNILTDGELDTILKTDIKVDKELFATPDYREAQRIRELGHKVDGYSYTLTFEKLLKNTTFPETMRNMLSLLSRTYDYPVDIEFTANFSADGKYSINLVQCRPLQTKGLGKAVDMPELKDCKDCLFQSKGNFMGGNVRLPIDYIVYVDPMAYIELPERDKYSVARQIGEINQALKGRNSMLIGPGRWGTTTPSLGVPVHFSELCNMSVICEMAFKAGGLMPELSYGSHFFQDLVESGIFYVALFDNEDVVFNKEKILRHDNILEKVLTKKTIFSNVIHVAKIDGTEIYSDTVSQVLICK